MYFLVCRTSNLVILGEHDRSSNAENIQVMKIAKVCIRSISQMIINTLIVS